MIFNASELGYKKLNNSVREAAGDITVNGCCGERFIGAGSEGKTIIINGTPGNALGAYLNGSVIRVNGNAQDAVGDTMNDGRIVIYGSAGDALGYAMRGGSILVRDGSGYRTGIHMKQYKDKCPSITVGGSAGSFLGEYLAGGSIIVLGLDTDGSPVGNFTGTGMHGGEIWLRAAECPDGLPGQVSVKKAEQGELDRIMPRLEEYSETFGVKMEVILSRPFWLLVPNAKNPYKRLYTVN